MNSDTSLYSIYMRAQAKKGDGGLLRGEILKAATALVVERGTVVDISIDSICERAGCTPPAIYMHFESKDDLFVRVAGQVFEDYFASAAETVFETNGGQTLLAIGKRYIDFGLAHPELYRQLFMTYPDLLHLRQRHASAVFAATREAVRRGIDSGLFAEEDTEKLALMLWAALHGVVALMITFPDREWPDDLAESLLLSLGRGMQAPG